MWLQCIKNRSSAGLYTLQGPQKTGEFVKLFSGIWESGNDKPEYLFNDEKLKLSSDSGQEREVVNIKKEIEKHYDHWTG